jgi:hypothetical protein
MTEPSNLAMFKSAIADALRGSYAPPQSGYARATYDYVYGETSRRREAILADVRAGTPNRPDDPAARDLYELIYEAIQADGIAVTGKTDRLDPPEQPPPLAATGRTERLAPAPRPQPVCLACGGRMGPILIVDRGDSNTHSQLSYTSPEKNRSFWTGTYPLAGTVEALMCRRCGLIALYGVPNGD